MKGKRVEVYTGNECVQIIEGDFLVQRSDNGYILHEKQLDLRKIYLEITGRCNLDCITCIRHSWKQSPGDMEMGLFQKILDDLEELPKCREVVLGGFGEPLLHPEIKEIINRLKERGYKVKITSNGMLLKDDIMKKLVESQLDEVIVSVDSFKKERFADIRRSELNNLLNNLENLKKLKEDQKTIFPRVGIEFVLMQKNQEELKNLSLKARKLGVLSILVTHLLPYQKKMIDEILYGRGNRKQQLALKLWTSPVPGSATMCTMNLPSPNWGAERNCNFVSSQACTVTWKGEISSCYALMHSNKHFVFGREKHIKAHSFGNVAKMPLKEIWNSPQYLKFRKRVRYFDFPSCVDCELSDNCTYPKENQDCWGNDPSCADCLWAQNIVRCP